MFRARWLIFLVLLSIPAVYAATQRLYLKDGTYHMVREYKVQKDRVSYYSTERGDWEELPLELISPVLGHKNAAGRVDVKAFAIANPRRKAIAWGKCLVRLVRVVAPYATTGFQFGARVGAGYFGLPVLGLAGISRRGNVHIH